MNEYLGAVVELVTPFIDVLVGLVGLALALVIADWFINQVWRILKEADR